MIRKTLSVTVANITQKIQLNTQFLKQSKEKRTDTVEYSVCDSFHNNHVSLFNATQINLMAFM